MLAWLQQQGTHQSQHSLWKAGALLALLRLNGTTELHLSGTQGSLGSKEWSHSDITSQSLGVNVCVLVSVRSELIFKP